jgi:hypothetical protein
MLSCIRFLQQSLGMRLFDLLLFLTLSLPRSMLNILDLVWVPQNAFISMLVVWLSFIFLKIVFVKSWPDPANEVDAKKVTTGVQSITPVDELEHGKSKMDYFLPRTPVQSLATRRNEARRFRQDACMKR